MAFELDIDSIFSFHPAGPLAANDHDMIRNELRQVAHFLNQNLPAGAEKTLAIRKLQEAMFYANSAIAQHYAKTDHLS